MAGRLCLLLSFFCFFTSCSTRPELMEEDAGAEIPFNSSDDPVELTLPGEDLPVSSFPEIWGYLVAGRESAFSKSLPLSDIGYFGAEIDTYGKLTGIPNPRNIRNFSGRIHLVVVCNNRSLAHFVLREGSAERKALITDLLLAVKNFDGLQIDFELIPQRDAETFFSFLGELRTGIGDKLFTIALPARTRALNADVFDYRRISPLVDRVLVMAYDEHWAASDPGPIASLPWCESVAQYALGLIGREKLIMGLPFYGRAWGNINPSKAYLYSGIQAILKERNITGIRRENGIPAFDYEVPVTVTVYYEDDYSLSARMEIYKTLGVRAVGFWRLGQETPAVWKILQLERE
jgi:spore germination protein YaaH